MLASVLEMFRAGGPVMWPLLVMSLATLTLVVERGLYWARAEGRASRRALAEVARVRSRPEGLTDVPRGLAPPYDGLVSALWGALSRGTPARETEALAAQAIEEVRPQVERYSATLSTIITAAPMLGILGTVTGIIASFRILSNTTLRDPTAVAGGIAEALITTAFGLIVALVALFPYMAFRAKVERCYSRMETLIDLALVAASHRPETGEARSEPVHPPARTIPQDAARLPRATRSPEESPSTAGQGGG